MPHSGEINARSYDERERGRPYGWDTVAATRALADLAELGCGLPPHQLARMTPDQVGARLLTHVSDLRHTCEIMAELGKAVSATAHRRREAPEGWAPVDAMVWETPKLPPGTCPRGVWFH